MSNASQITANATEIWCNKTLHGDDDTVFNNSYMIFTLIVGGFVWILIFKSLYYWFVRDVTGLMIWFNSRELYRRLQLQTSNDTHHVNGLNAWGVDNIKPVKNQKQIDELILRSEYGDLNNTYNSYADLRISLPQMITVVPTQRGYKPVVESVQIHDKHVVDTTSNHLGGFHQKTVRSKSKTPNDHDEPAALHRRNNRKKRTESFENDVNRKHSFGDYEHHPASRYDEEIVHLYDESHIEQDDVEHRDGSGGSYWIARLLFCDQYRTKSKKKCCPWIFDFSASKKGSNKYEKSKRRMKGRNDLSDYDRTVENPNDQFSVDVNDKKRFWRGNFFILLCDFIVLMSIVLVFIGIYLSMDVELDSYFSAQNVALVIAAFKLTEISNGLVGYISMIMHNTIYRGDIVKIVGTWTGIGGSISGVVLDINVSDVLLLVNTPFVSHFGGKRTETETDSSRNSKPKKKFASKGTKKLSSVANVVDNDVSKIEEEEEEQDRTVHTRRYFPFHTAASAPKLRRKMTEEQLTKMASEFGGRYEKTTDASSVRNDKNGEKIARRANTANAETIGYIRFDQRDVDTDEESVHVTMARSMNDIEIVRLNTNMVYTSVISRILGFETHMHISFEEAD